MSQYGVDYQTLNRCFFSWFRGLILVQKIAWMELLVFQTDCVCQKLLCRLSREVLNFFVQTLKNQFFDKITVKSVLEAFSLRNCHTKTAFQNNFLPLCMCIGANTLYNKTTNIGKTNCGINHQKVVKYVFRAKLYGNDNLFT